MSGWFLDVGEASIFILDEETVREAISAFWLRYFVPEIPSLVEPIALISNLV
jgi:hypothetical protein